MFCCSPRSYDDPVGYSSFVHSFRFKSISRVKVTNEKNYPIVRTIILHTTLCRPIAGQVPHDETDFGCYCRHVMCSTCCRW